MSNDLRSYIDANNSLPPDCVLGSLAWFTVEDGAYDGQIIEQLFNHLNLNPAFLPAALNPADAFEKASNELDGRKYKVNVTGIDGEAEVLVREVARTNHVIERHMIREIRDASQRRLSYTMVGKFVYYRPIADADGRIKPDVVAQASGAYSQTSCAWARG